MDDIQSSQVKEWKQLLFIGISMVSTQPNDFP